MKSLCIKTNNSNLLRYLLNELAQIDLDNICFSENQFKNYKNIIIHYNGNDNCSFISKISTILSYMIIDEEEDILLKRILLQNYFYLDNTERDKIITFCYDIMSDDFSAIFDKKFKVLHECFFQFLSENKSIILTGFINFRIQKYISILDEIANEAVNHFIIEKEYLEFISLLKLYISSQTPNCNIVHIIYRSSESILLDENMNTIITTNDIFKAKYLSDISFSSNDYTLNSLLNLLPKKIYIHLIDNYIDEFINTLKLVFENKVSLCTDCNICEIYKCYNIEKNT